MGTAEERRFETLCQQRFSGASLETLIPLAGGTTVDGKPIGEDWKAAITKRVAREALLNHEHIEALLSKMLSLSQKKPRQLGVELLRAYVARQRERNEDQSTVLIIILKALAVSHDRQTTTVLQELLKGFPEDAIREALATQLKVIT